MSTSENVSKNRNCLMKCGSVFRRNANSGISPKWLSYVPCLFCAVEKDISEGRRGDLTGGGLIRSSGGYTSEGCKLRFFR